MNSEQNILSFENFGLTYVDKKKENRIIQNLSFEIPQDKIVGLIGKSGSGKSSLSRCILGLQNKSKAKTEGEIIFQKEGTKTDLLEQNINWKDIRGHQISMIFQESKIHLSPTRKCGKQLLDHLYILNPNYTEKEAIVYLDKFGFINSEKILNAYPFEISGGQAQRLQIAMALSTSPTLLICDEITSSLDSDSKMEIMNLLLKIKGERELSILFISHDLKSVEYICDTVISLDKEKEEKAIELFEIEGLKDKEINQLKIENLNFGYKSELLFENLHYTFHSNKIYGILGRSGAGKTTLAKIIAKTIKIDKGIIKNENKYSRNNVVYLYQDPHLALNPKLSIKSQLSDIYNISKNKLSFTEFISIKFKAFDLDLDLLRSFPKHLSGGQKQRINLIRALCHHPFFLICDEIFSALDIKTKNLLYKELLKLNRIDGLGIIMISHDIETINYLSDIILELKDKSLNVI